MATIEAVAVRPNNSGPSRVLRGKALDVGAVMLLTALALLGFHASYGGWLFLGVGLAGAIVGAAVSLLAVQYRQPGAVLALAALVVVVALAAALALRGTAVAGVLPSKATLVGLAQGFTSGWRELVTTPPPVGEVGNLLAIPYVCGFLSALLGVWGALRSRRLWWGVLPPLTVLAAGIVTGLPEPVSLLLQGGLFGVVVLGWASLRARRATTTVIASRRRFGRAAAGILIVLGVGLVAPFLGPRMPGADAQPRLLARTYVEPDVDPSQFASPLAQARRWLLLKEKQTLFTVSGLPNGQPVRLAVMDSWDGTAFAVAGGTDDPSGGAFRRVGRTISADVQGTPATVTIQIRSYDDVWLPTVGQLTGIDVSGTNSDLVRSEIRYDTETASGLVAVPPTSASQPAFYDGTVLTLDTVIPTVPSEKELKALAKKQIGRQPQNAPLPASVRQMAGDAVGESTGPYERAQSIAAYLVAQGFYTRHKAPDNTDPGHGSGRLDEMAKQDRLVGDEEQYGALAALMAREEQLPTRLVLGFTPTGSGAVAIKGSDLTVWLEVALDGAGWVPVGRITPPRDKHVDTAPDPKPKPRPQVQVPPPPAADIQTPAIAAPANADQTDDQTDASRSLPAWLLPVVLGVGIPLLVVALFVMLVLGLKRRRARRRRHDPDPSRAVTNGWSEMMDVARDHRLHPSILATRIETATTLLVERPVLTDELESLAHRADAAAFGPGSPTSEQIDAYWADVASARDGLEAGMGPIARWRARLNLRSVLGGSRPPRPKRGRRRTEVDA